MAEGAKGLENAGLGFALVGAAGLSTAIGAAAVFEKRIVKFASKPVLAAGLGFAAGVMLYVSFGEILGKSYDSFVEDGRDENDAYLCSTATFFSGMLLLRLVSLVVHLVDHHHHDAGDADFIEAARETSAERPPLENSYDLDAVTPHSDYISPENVVPELVQTSSPADIEAKKQAQDKADARKLQQMGLKTAAAIAIHNFPEGLATFIGTLADPHVGVTLAVAIGIHNIPEGLCVALPIFYATESRWKGFLWAMLSGVSEPIGALIGYLVLLGTGNGLSSLVFGILFGVVSGMMVMIVIMELMPTAVRYDPTDKYVTKSIVFGMVVMAISLCLFKL